MTELNAFRQRLGQPDFLFQETLTFIARNYHYQPAAFRNGPVSNPAGENEGSCKTLALALLEDFTTEEALLCFGEHYRSVLDSPQGHDHANIRALLQHGLKQIEFTQPPLTRRS